jgi:polyisoprenoid-binding protein YceI
MITTHHLRHASGLIRKVGGVELPAAGLWNIPSGWAEIEVSLLQVFGPTLRSRISLKQGMIAIADDPAHSTAHLSLDAASLRTGNETIDGYLQEEVLDTRRYSTLPVRIDTVAHRGGSNWVAEGWVTVRGVARPIELAVSYEGVFRHGPAALFRAEASLPLRSVLPGNRGTRRRLLGGRTLRIDIEIHAEPARTSALHARLGHARSGHTRSEWRRDAELAAV